MFGMKNSTSSETQQCMDDCHHCHMTCLQMAATHCLEMGGTHTDPQHMRLMLDCAEICQTALNFMARNSDHHAVICRARSAARRSAICRNASTLACAVPRAASEWPQPTLDRQRGAIPDAGCSSGYAMREGNAPAVRICPEAGRERKYG
jgi:hypothetical protein